MPFTFGILRCAKQALTWRTAPGLDSHKIDILRALRGDSRRSLLHPTRHLRRVAQQLSRAPHQVRAAISSCEGPCRYTFRSSVRTAIPRRAFRIAGRGHKWFPFVPIPVVAAEGLAAILG